MGVTQIKPVPREAILIVNAASRKGRDLFKQAHEKIAAAGIHLIEAHAVRNPKKLIPTVKKAVKSGAPMVIVGGGDGSLSSAVDEVVERDCVFALLPLGTANSFARTLGIPIDLDGAIETIATGERRRIDLGMIDDDYFGTCAAMGLSPMIGEGIPHNLKRYLGRIGYLGWATWCLARFRPFRLTIRGDGIDETLWATEVRIANGRHHGGVELIESANLNSGEIVVQVVEGKSSLKLVRDWASKYWKLKSRQGTTREFHGKRLELRARPRQRISIDGEVLASTPCVAQAAKCAIEVVVPRGATRTDHERVASVAAEAVADAAAANAAAAGAA